MAPEISSVWRSIQVIAFVVGCLLALVVDVLLWKALEPEPMVQIPGIRDPGRNWIGSLMCLAFATTLTVWGAVSVANLLELVVCGPVNVRNKGCLFFAAIFGVSILFAVASASIGLKEYMPLILFGGFLGGAIAGSLAAERTAST